MLPNRLELLHPLIVHFPIAIAGLWCILELIAFSWEKRRKEYDMVFLIFALIGAATAFFANMTGEWAESVHQGQLQNVAQLIDHHADLAVYVVWFYLLLTVIAAVILIMPVQWARILRFGIACGLLIIVAIAASRGANLVYEHGLGVKWEGVKQPWQKPSTK